MTKTRPVVKSNFPLTANSMAPSWGVTNFSGGDGGV
jgi:hypothetical protein